MKIVNLRIGAVVMIATFAPFAVTSEAIAVPVVQPATLASPDATALPVEKTALRYGRRRGLCYYRFGWHGPGLYPCRFYRGRIFGRGLRRVLRRGLRNRAGIIRRADRGRIGRGISARPRRYDVQSGLGRGGFGRGTRAGFGNRAGIARPNSNSYGGDIARPGRFDGGFGRTLRGPNSYGGVGRAARPAAIGVPAGGGRGYGGAGAARLGGGAGYGGAGFGGRGFGGGGAGMGAGNAAIGSGGRGVGGGGGANIGGGRGFGGGGFSGGGGGFGGGRGGGGGGFGGGGRGR